LIDLRKPVLEDGPQIFQLAGAAGNLDVNSSYHYLLLSLKFSETCVVAFQKRELIGFITAFRDPQHPEVLFVWQVAVSPAQRNGGVAKAMLNHLLQREFNPEIQYIETTITPSNISSQALFRSLANECHCEIKEQDLINKELFPENGHEPEHLFRIGPLNPN
jgi:L-2,4-diaminobutyric acid acetyltransferase